MQVYDIALKPGDTRLIDVQARYIYFMNGSAGGADTTVAFRPATAGETIYLKPGQAYRLGEAERSQTRWALTNLAGQATINGQILMGDGEFIDNRITGSVEVVDGGKARTLAGVAFQAASSSGLGSAGQYPHVQLWNPANSGRRLIVKQVMLSAIDAQQVGLIASNAELPNVSAKGVSKALLGAASVGMMEYGGNAVLQGSGSALIQPYMGANSNMIFTFTEPVVINPGSGLLMRGVLQNSTIGASFEYIEEAI